MISLKILETITTVISLPFYIVAGSLIGIYTFIDMWQTRIVLVWRGPKHDTD